MCVCVCVCIKLLESHSGNATGLVLSPRVRTDWRARAHDLQSAAIVHALYFRSFSGEIGFSQSLTVFDFFVLFFGALD